MNHGDRGHESKHIRRNIPNVLTVLALCAGLSSIRMTMDGQWEPAIYLILVAVILDGLDGRMARLLDVASDFGAELDSLADFLNFGIAPAFLIYSQIYQGTAYDALGWLVCMCLVVCCMLRLARFNLAQDDDPSTHFVGVPAPALAFLALMPVYLLQTRFDYLSSYCGWMSIYLLCIAFLAISTVRTLSIKVWRPKRQHMPLCALTASVAVVSLLTFVWYTLVLACVAYLMTIVLSVSKSRAAHVQVNR